MISGDTIKENQPPKKDYYAFKSTENLDITTIHETSGTTGIPKSFFLTDDDWAKYIEKYARAFKSQGFEAGESIVVCAAYGMNISADSMSLTAKKLNITAIPEGKCTFPVRIIENYKPTSIVGSIFKFLRLANRMKENHLDPQESSIIRLISGEESFAEESRKYIEEIWGVEVFNTYGSTEGTMCGECSEKSGIHVPEDLIHLDIYKNEIEADPIIRLNGLDDKNNSSESCFVDDGKNGKVILTHLLNKGEKAGTLLINYDTDDSSSVITRKKCKCGRTHMKINNPIRNTETIKLFGTSINKTAIESGVFQRENMDYLTGEYESFIYINRNENVNKNQNKENFYLENEKNTYLKVSFECETPENTNKDIIENNFLKSFFNNKKELEENYNNDKFKIEFEFLNKGELEFYKSKKKAKRISDFR